MADAPRNPRGFHLMNFLRKWNLPKQKKQFDHMPVLYREALFGQAGAARGHTRGVDTVCDTPLERQRFIALACLIEAEERINKANKRANIRRGGLRQAGAEDRKNRIMAEFVRLYHLVNDPGSVGGVMINNKPIPFRVVEAGAPLPPAQYFENMKLLQRNENVPSLLLSYRALHPPVVAAQLSRVEEQAQEADILGDSIVEQINENPTMDLSHLNDALASIDGLREGIQAELDDETDEEDEDEAGATSETDEEDEDEAGATSPSRRQRLIRIDEDEPEERAASPEAALPRLRGRRGQQAATAINWAEEAYKARFQKVLKKAMAQDKAAERFNKMAAKLTKTIQTAAERGGNSASASGRARSPTSPPLPPPPVSPSGGGGSPISDGPSAETEAQTAMREATEREEATAAREAAEERAAAAARAAAAGPFPTTVSLITTTRTDAGTAGAAQKPTVTTAGLLTKISQGVQRGKCGMAAMNQKVKAAERKAKAAERRAKTAARKAEEAASKPPAPKVAKITEDAATAVVASRATTTTTSRTRTTRTRDIDRVKAGATLPPFCSQDVLPHISAEDYDFDSIGGQHSLFLTTLKPGELLADEAMNFGVRAFVHESGGRMLNGFHVYASGSSVNLQAVRFTQIYEEQVVTGEVRDQCPFKFDMCEPHTIILVVNLQNHWIVLQWGFKPFFELEAGAAAIRLKREDVMEGYGMSTIRIYDSLQKDDTENQQIWSRDENFVSRSEAGAQVYAEIREACRRQLKSRSLRHLGERLEAMLRLINAWRLEQNIVAMPQLIIKTMNPPRQPDFVNCGVYALASIEVVHFHKKLWHFDNLMRRMFWKMKAKLARKYFAAPATSAESERLFSTAGQIITNLRSSLKDENVEKLLFLHHNIKIYDFNYA